MIRIGDRKIGHGNPTFVIAEIGINHNGKIELAKKLIDIAVEAGADVAKFQSWTAESLVARNNPDFNRLKDIEFPKELHKEIADYCANKGIIFMSSAFDNKEVDFLDELGVPAHKIASCELTNLPFVSYVAKKGKPIIISTGFGKLDEVSDAVNTIIKNGNKNIILLHCIGAYPPNPEDMNLKYMHVLEKEFGLPVGLSDHSMTTEIPIAAVALGAVCIEKHITLDKNMEGFDHKASMEPDELKRMIDGIRIVEKALGTGEREIKGIEAELIKVMRKSVLAAKDISIGETITDELMTVKRPGEGLSAKEIPKIVGRKAKRPIKEGDYIRLEDIE
ncbi:MAG: N-acetylneuraminate synthase family protein [Nanoarchaeota archaeon]|nr:N-acetylneuraminate synthase family protein [Nanoarchaeota archaeon]